MMIRGGVRRVFALAVGGRRRWEREVEEEIKLHLSLRVEQLIADGVAPDDAYREAVRRFGPLTESRARLVDAARHREQHMRRTEYFADLRQDLSFALRTLRRQNGWTAVTILTMALGVGATTAVFSVVSSLLIHAVPYPNGNRVMLVYQQPSEGNNTGVNVSILPAARVVRAWKQNSHSFEALEGYWSKTVATHTTSGSASLNVALIEPTFPNFAGVRPIRGRMFTQADIDSSSHLVLLSEGFWQTRFGGADSVIGQRITYDSAAYTIVGVLPATLRTPEVGVSPPDLWAPLDVRDNDRGLQVVGRLRPGINAQTAATELDSLFARDTRTGKPPFRSVVVPPAQRVTFYDSLMMLTFAVALVLLVACANVAHLLMARSASRQRELAIRTALGAGRGRVFRQLLTESLLIATTGTAFGVLVGWLGMKTLIALRPSTLSQLSTAHLDPTTLGLAVVVAITTAIAFGLLGALQAGRVATHDALKATSTNSSRGRGARIRTLLVVSEMALSATLVVGATMLVRSVINMQNADLGFEPKGLYSLDVSSDKKGYFGSPAEHAAFTRSLMTRLAEIHGIRSVALAWNPPTRWAFTIGALETQGDPPPAEGSTALIQVNRIGSTYFRTMGMRLAQGTPFTDTTGAAHQVIVNAGFARKHWPDASAVGRRIRIRQSGSEPWLTIVGVVEDALTAGARAETSAPMIYSAAADSSDATILIRTDGTADPVTPVRALVRSIDPTLTSNVNSVREQMSQQIAEPRFIMLLLSVFTILALALAAIGLYGVMSFSVAERTREIGIRVALGASRGRVARTVIAGGVVLALVGSVIGMIAASWGTKLIEKQLYGVARSDAVSFIAAIVVLFGAAVAACVVPTKRALAVDPMTAIRAD